MSSSYRASLEIDASPAQAQETPPSTATSRLPTWLKASISILLSLLIAALLLEAALRVAFYHSLDFSMEMWKYAVQLKQPDPNPNLSFTNLPNGHGFLMGQDVQISSQGLRDREFSLAKPPGTYRIMMLGDSTTFGWGVGANETASKVLERELNTAKVPGYNRFEVLNTGVGNYDTVQEVTYYETRGRKFHPDLVVLVYFINDPEPVPMQSRIPFMDRSYLVAYVYNRWDGLLRRTGTRPDWRAYYASLYDDSQPGFQACKAALRELAEATRRDHAKVIVALLPELHQINHDYPFTAAHQKIKGIVEAENMPAIELIDGLRNHGPEETLWVTPLDDHPSAKAQALIAAQLRDVVLKELGATNSATAAQSSKHTNQ